MSHNKTKAVQLQKENYEPEKNNMNVVLTSLKQSKGNLKLSLLGAKKRTRNGNFPPSTIQECLRMEY
jgi:hypothetical protein